MKNILFLLAIAVCSLSTFAQQKKWHDLEGYFQSSTNDQMVVHFAARDSMLVAKLLWNNGEIHLLPDTGLNFVSKEVEDGNAIHIRFQLDPSGAVNRVNVANNGVWNRIADYKPKPKLPIAHTPDELQKFIGLYQLKADTTRYIRLGVDSNTITIHQMWDGNVVDNFVPETPMNFFKVEQPIFTLNFSADQDGRITRILALGRDVWTRINPQPINTARFKSYEGKYQSKDDPDNEIQLFAADSGLIVRQLWDRTEFRLYPVTNSYFYNEQRSYPLHIVTDDKGQVKGILVLGIEFFNKITP